MTKGRLEAFSDGVLAIIITIMVLELKVPHHHHFEDLRPLIPVFLSYALSFVYIGIYWNNHHHMLHAVKHINGAVLWANLHLLFWLSLVPFATGWMGENQFKSDPVALYGFVLLMAALAYFILSRVLIAADGKDSKLAAAFGNDLKGKISILLYVAAIVLALIRDLPNWPAMALYIVVAIIWLVPDRRIEKKIDQ